MDTTSFLKLHETIKALSSTQINALLQSIRTKKDTKKKTKPVSFCLKINNKTFKQTVNGNDVVKHFMEDIIPDIRNMPPYAIKQQIVGMFEMLAEAEDSSSLKSKWREKASKVALIASQENLFSYVANLATGINMKSYA